MANAVNVDFITRVVEIEVDDNKPESLSALAAINAAQRADEAAELVVTNIDETLAALDEQGNREKVELNEYTDEKKAELDLAGSQYVEEASTILTAIRNEYGYPFTAATASAMTDTKKIYVYTGSETGYTNGNWYYHNGTAFVSGGVYNSTAFETDTTLAISGMAADAKETGDRIGSLQDKVYNVEDTKQLSKRLLGNYSTGLYRSASRESTNKWITTDHMYNFPYGVEITLPTGTRAIYAEYDSDGLYVTSSSFSNLKRVPKDTNFRLSIQWYPQQVITDVDELLSLVEINSWDLSEATDLSVAVSNMAAASIAGGTFPVAMESGSKNLDGTLSETATRMRTLKGYEFPAYYGDTIRLSDYTKYKMYVRWTNKDGVLATSGSWLTADWTVTEDGSHYLLVEKVDGSAFTRDDFKDVQVSVVTGGILKREPVQDWASLSMFPKIGVCGDSWASGSLHHPDGSGWTGNYDLSWPQILGRRIGATVLNFTKGGLSTKTWLSNTDYGLSVLLAAEPQNLYILNFGINDNTQINNGTLTVGTIADCKEDYTQNPDTFYGDYGRIIGNIMAHAPASKQIILSVGRPAERANMDPRIQEIAEHYGIPYIYLPDDAFFTSSFFTGSIYEGHPVSYGYAGMATAIERLILRDIENNPAYYGTYYGTTETGTANE